MSQTFRINYQPKNIIVTGGAGFIGSNFIRYLLSLNANIHIINFDKLTYAGSLNHLTHLTNSSYYHFIQGDICDEKLVSHVLQHHQIDTIVHFAAESHVDRSIANPRTFVETNVLGTYVLLEAARHYWFDVAKYDVAHCRFHHISTDEVFGSLSPNEPLFTESHRYQPNSPYSATKAGADHLVRAYHHTYGLPTTLSYCSNNYGPFQHQEKFIPTVIRSALNDQPIPLYGTGKNIRDWLYVTDHCHAINQIIKHGKVGECYAIGGNNEWENIELAKYICQQLNRLKPREKPYENNIKMIHDRPGHDFRYAIDATKIKNELGWQPQESLASGMLKTIEFYLS